ncbi:DUF4124 domain-containing protein [Beggiatoa leptomitoformis]|uniref:DUF4124 domain-containing protein n=1 Tax=Beggiatoa leptomitoformis TaxID=288004 RepID=A0A2N9YAY3_9GAMM|nr:DUF4124 domain-containing protein [Beggiatoa leptomitoformis]AUI67626.1 DUF4124 domain-containing protein [Beggiatoa leptomitoformis]QGX03524.1 DUF4124 domain-containing protein [Beggiatoa leptomitoformis]
MKSLWVIGLVSVLSLPVYAGKLYQWVDAEGNTQFSQTPPPEGTDAETKNIATPPATVAAPKPEEKPAEPPVEEAAKHPAGNDPAAKIKAEKEEKCQQANSMLQQLTAKGSLVIPKADNPKEFVPMSDDARKQRTAEAQAFIDAYCKDSAPATQNK